MVTPFNLGLLILAVLTTTVAEEDIKVFCDKDSIRITWRLNAEMVPSRLFLGKCRASGLNALPTGEREAEFNYKFAECKFTKAMKGKHVHHKSTLTYRPENKSKPAALSYPIECVYKRQSGWVPTFLNPGSGVSQGRGGLVFHMALLDNQLKGLAKTNVIPLGSLMPIWAAVEQKSHQPLLLLMDECVAATTLELRPDSQLHPVVGNKGCLWESMRGNSKFLPRYHTSSITLLLQSFKFPHGQEVYIHCKLVAWNPNFLGESKKACNYIKETSSWELLDNPSQSGICSCCDSTCKSRYRRGVDSDSHGISHISVLGPLIIMDPYDLEAHNSSTSVPAAASRKLRLS